MKNLLFYRKPWCISFNPIILVFRYSFMSGYSKLISNLTVLEFFAYIILSRAVWYTFSILIWLILTLKLLLVIHLDSNLVIDWKFFQSEQKKLVKSWILLWEKNLDLPFECKYFVSLHLIFLTEEFNHLTWHLIFKKSSN